LISSNTPLSQPLHDIWIMSRRQLLPGPNPGQSCRSRPFENRRDSLASEGKKVMGSSQVEDSLEGIAIIGMAIRFPGADTPEQFWHNLKNGVESITFFTDQQLKSAGVAPALLQKPNYVKARPMLEGIDLFDAAFFGFSPREAEILDPQQRIFLECAWEALENAGYDSETTPYRIAVYAGTSRSSYIVYNVMPNRAVVESVGAFHVLLSNDQEHLATRASYKLNLKGPSVNVNTACSTSLVSVCLACQGLLNYQSDIALAGGASILVPQVSGYLYQEGGITSADGHCRTFDAKAKGAIFGNGVGLVVLKRLKDALADGDTVHAVIRGFAINNDGSMKVGYTAPSVEGQAEVISEAIAIAGIDPESIGYIEAHGTATPMGDPIEVAALTKAFRQYTQKSGFCAIGSVKTNVGHLNSAAGVAGLIKTILSLKNKMLPPALHYEKPNPAIDFESSPFVVNDVLREWIHGPSPRRAGVSSFGVGGTNAHVILEEPPEQPIEPSSEGCHLLVLSAKTASALNAMAVNLARHLESNPDLDLGDVAHTLRLGRRVLEHRRAIVCRDRGSALAALHEQAESRSFSRHEYRRRSVAFMFPGQGSQYVNMGIDAYQKIPTFREDIDRCAKILKPLIGTDLLEVLYPEVSVARMSERLKDTVISQPAIFTVEYALARLWMHWGVQPQAMIGHSIGEFVAACLAGVFSLEDALEMIALRGKLLQELPRGSMLAVGLSENELLKELADSLSIAAVNANTLCTVSGPSLAVEELERKLTERGVGCQRLHTSHAFHSKMVEPAVEPFRKHMAGVTLNTPEIPFLSCETGQWVTGNQATDPNYWAQHLRRCVRFSNGLELLMTDPDRVLLEVGPGQALTSLVMGGLGGSASCDVLSSLPHPMDSRCSEEHLLRALGRLWVLGIDIDWTRFEAGLHRRRIPLPTYPFERKSYWIEAAKHPSSESIPAEQAAVRLPVQNWFYKPVWIESPLPTGALTGPEDEGLSYLILMDDSGLGEGLAEHLRRLGHEVATAVIGTRFDLVAANHYTVDPGSSDDFLALIEAVKIQSGVPRVIWHLWGISGVSQWNLPDHLEKTLDHGFYSLIHLAKALGKQSLVDPVQIAVVTNGMQRVSEAEDTCPEKATILGPSRVIPKEYPKVQCRSIDIVLPDSEGSRQKLLEQLIQEIWAELSDTTIAYRDGKRWVEDFESVDLEGKAGSSVPLRERGTYMITGGLGGIGLVIAEYLARAVQAKLVLVGRSPFPERKAWESLLRSRGDGDPLCRKIRRVEAIESFGCEVLIVRADVSSPRQMEEAYAKAKERFGKVNGIIHAAGVPDGAIIQRRRREKTDAVLAPKVKGTLVLDSLFKDAGLDFFVLCSSLASLLGPFGQVGYCAANAFLDAFAHSKSARSSTLTSAIDWDIWKDVGMAVEQRISTAAMKTYGGLEPVMMHHPLFEQHKSEGFSQEVFVSLLSVSEHWVLDEHRIVGSPTLPGTAYLEIVRNAFEVLTGVGTCEIRDLYFLRPMLVGEMERKEVRTILTSSEDGFDFMVLSRMSPDADSWQQNVIGKVVPLAEEPPSLKDMENLYAECTRQIDALTADSFNGKIEFGPRWNSIKWIRLGDNQGLACLELTRTFLGDMDHYVLHPALLDVGAGFLIPALESRESYLPFFYKRITIRGRLPAKLFSHAVVRDRKHPQTEIVKLDISVLDEQGVELVEIEEYTLRKVDIEKVAGPKKETGSDVEVSSENVQNCRLDAATPGLLDSLRFFPAVRTAPKADEVEIEVSFTGLNFKDILLALDVLPSMRELFNLGMECTGRIVSMGENVERFNVGDEVLAFAPAAFSSYVVTPASGVARKPAGLTLEEAATIPVAYMTAYYALIKSGRLSRGERVLIHAATGGVGLASVKIAQWLGAEIFATAGSPEKRVFLQSLGIEHVMDSRSLAFADEIMEQTDGAGVHVVLNSLAGDFISKSLSVLAPYGRFLEIGIRDILLDSKLSLRPFSKSLSYTAVMLGPQLPHFANHWRELMEHVDAGDFAPLPYRVFNAMEVTDAFMHMAHAKHMGKVLISMQDREALFEKASSAVHLHSRVAERPPAEESSFDHYLAVARGATSRDYDFAPDNSLVSPDAGISSSEGTMAFNGVLGIRLPQIIVSTQDLRRRIDESRAFNLDKLQQTLEAIRPGKTHARPDLRSAYVAPRNETERKLAEIWQLLFGIDRIGIHDNFFELGGHSLLAIQINSKVRETFQVELPTESLFEQPTVAVLAEHVNALMALCDSRSVPATQESGREEILL
jgi:acyl transferase domain-containing protein/NADPH:quinone reductase-like Zn-dependent oxidoreductase/acyl carrier protein